MYSVYFDNILQRPQDIIDINDSFETSIVRQDGFDSQAQIIREKSEANITFSGKAYKYVCDTLKLDACHVFQVKIEDASCGYVYNGTMSIVGMERDLSKCICKSDLKDNSFSAYIDGYLDSELPLYNTKSKNCQILPVIIKEIAMPYDVTNPNLLYTIKAFDVLDVFNYIISYFTDNTISVVSDYLTDNKYAITTGFNMHNYSNSINEVYPNLSFNKLFNELRKKLRIYMAIEYDAYGVPYLRIEDENYFFSDVELFSIAEIPKDTIQTYDNKRNFNQISIGSDKTDVLDVTPITYQQNRYVSWIKEFYSNCGSCVGEKQSELNLVSEFIIDSNDIIEALIYSTSDQYDNDNEIFMFNYYNTDSTDKGVFTLDTLTSYYYYNDTLRNENVLSNYLDYSQQCIAIQRNAKYGFLATNPNIADITIGGGGSITASNCDYIRILGTYGGSMIANLLGNNEIYDNKNTIENINPIYDTSGFFDSFGLTKFTCQEDGIYVFNAKSKIKSIQDVPKNYVFPLQVDYEIRFVVYSDNTFTTETQSSDITYLTTLSPETEVLNFDIESPPFSLTTNNVVVVEIKIPFIEIIGTGFYYLTAIYDTSFQLVSDNFNCQSETIGVDSMPYVTNFEYPLCFSDYNLVNNNKRGYINIAGVKHWIREIKYLHKKMSSFTLMSNELLCGC